MPEKGKPRTRGIELGKSIVSRSGASQDPKEIMPEDLAARWSKLFGYWRSEGDQSDNRGEARPQQQVQLPRIPLLERLRLGEQGALMPPRRITGPDRDLPDKATGHSPDPGFRRAVPGRQLRLGRQPLVWDRIDDPMRPLGSDYRSAGPSPVDRGRIPPRGAMDHA